ncbi:JmjC-domain-containing protein [Dendrothele bispora CBS 962.96]|uniref:[histone H3]-trimethyl-L-lysine(9) demethylase n=1 Tax=Dendrothele bispora (strain CBS 962.96) TaxID=1314807 RepID=A0A4S8M9L4_DENBC|nr:JmjC-domain-containing protein [Dendrothele bispora CBS 962.96]
MASSPTPSLTPSLTPSVGSSPPPYIPVQPDHFYRSDDQPTAHPSPNVYGKTWLDPEDDRLASRGIPVFKPTMEEFGDFEAYMNRVECWGMYSGIVKVIPPKEWTDALPPLREQLQSVKIKTPIEQHMLGRAGLFRQQNIEKRRTMSVREWSDLCNQDDYRAPSVDGLGARATPKNTRARKTRKATVKAETVEPDAVDDEVFIKEEPVDDAISAAHERVSGSPVTSADAEEKPKVKGRRQAQTKEVREARAAERLEKDAAFLETFDPGTAWLPPNTKADDYTPEFCAQLERHYWRNCGLGKDPWYGSLYTDETQEWNVAHLESELSRLLPSSDRGLPGVNTPYLYWGMWRATFAWHVEDMDLFSINYIHFGAPKFWYAIPQQQANRLEQTMRNYFPKDTSECSQFLRHKSFLLSPTLLAKSSCKPNHVVQHAGEFIITYPRGYHAGFNLGFNCAESVNFALKSWLEIGRVAKACECVGDSVRIDVDQLLRDRERERLEAEGPKSPRKVPKQSAAVSEDRVKHEELTLIIPPLPKFAKRKVENDLESAPKPKKQKTKPSSSKSTSSTSSSSSRPPLSLKIPPSAPSAPPKLTLKLGPRPTEPDTFPCCLCVSQSKEGLLRVQDPPSRRKEAMEACGFPKVWMAHEECANVVPETWVDEVDEDRKEKVVFGVDGIVKDRWNLKCSACTKNRPKAHGAPIQCTKGKCPKAFHVSCARDNKDSILFEIIREVEKEVVLLDVAPSVVHTNGLPQDSDAMEVDDVLKIIKKLEVEVLCAQHNPRIAAAKKASKQDKIKNELLALPPMSRIKIRVSAGVFEVSLIRVIEENSSVEVLWDRGIKREFKWGSVLFGNTDGPVQQKPSEPAAEPPSRPTFQPTAFYIPAPTYPSVAAATGSQSPSTAPAPPQQPYGTHMASQYSYPSGNLYPHHYWSQVYPGSQQSPMSPHTPTPLPSQTQASASVTAPANYHTQYPGSGPSTTTANISYAGYHTYTAHPHVNWQHYRPTSNYYAYNQIQGQATVTSQPVQSSSMPPTPAPSTPIVAYAAQATTVAVPPVATASSTTSSTVASSSSTEPSIQDLSSLSSLEPSQVAELIEKNPVLKAAVLNALSKMQGLRELGQGQQQTQGEGTEATNANVDVAATT